MNLFIDTNVYLSFYHFTSDDLDELAKLAVIMADKKVTLYVPKQVVDEFHRNREATISGALQQLKGQRLNLQFPQLCKDYSEYTILRDLQKKFEQAHADLLKKLTTDITAKTLKADKTIKMLFEQASHIPTSTEIIEKSRLRVDIGQPPGKKGSLGDAINWESLLSAIPSGDFYFVSDDRDYCSPLDESSFSQYLESEWKSAKGTELRFCKRLSQFFKDVFPDIKLSGELEKEILIRHLASSSSFDKTHLVLTKLSNLSGFTSEQLNAILEAYVSNNQIYWIISDPDVKSFIDQIVIGNQEVLDQNHMQEFMLIMKQESSPEENMHDMEPPPF